MNEEKIRKVLTGEADIAKMSHDDFVELLKCLGSMYLARVMNCVDGTGKSDKEWTALSSIFNRVAEAITEKPVGNSAAMREASQKASILLKVCDWPDDAPMQDIAKVIDEIEKRLPRRRGTATWAHRASRNFGWTNGATMEIGSAVAETTGARSTT